MVSNRDKEYKNKPERRMKSAQRQNKVDMREIERDTDTAFTVPSRYCEKKNNKQFFHAQNGW